ncbi:MAG: AbrB/MazE/SpoVT family DNA-binding domain-containing protein [Candidatus Pacebacteria bacterium]|nr:AbrB/MazE/SpoVT family DNA-binding domain-containing protein [Candidatus Paceibacterota bacterium]PIR59834.1 MAG: hypothetical protein COU68_03370 [Candidatus Pacebacteria bacterium CG10_big_fil_rev_8_21_14_0_10_45_6]
MLQTTITPNFQVHIPVTIRKQSGITQHGTAIISAQKGKIIIEAKPSGFLALGSSFQVKKPIKVEQIRDHIEYSR